MEKKERTYMIQYFGSSQFGPMEAREESKAVRYLAGIMGSLIILCLGILLGLKIGGRI